MLNKHLRICLIALALSVFVPFLLSCSPARATQKPKDGYNIKIKMKGAKDTVYLGYHYGSQIYIEDTFRLDPKTGVCEMKGEKTLFGGIYLAITMDKNAKGKKETKYFDFLVDNKEQHFSLEVDTSDFVKSMKITNSPTNDLFNKYQRYLATHQDDLNKWKTELDTLNAHKNKTPEDTVRARDLREKLTAKDKEINEYRLDFVKKNPTSLLTTIFKGMQEVQASDDVKKVDSLWLRYIRQHYWDNIDFNDERLVRTPVLGGKITAFLENYTVRTPDSIIVSANQIIDKSLNNKETFKFTLTQVMTMYENPKYMGMDAVFVNLAERYYLNADSKVYWMDTTRMKKLRERVNKIKPTLIGAQATPMVMQDTAMQTHKLYDVKAEYTVILFWSHSCGHCKKHMPEYIDIYNKYKSKNVDFYSVCTDPDQKEIKKFIVEQKVNFPVYFDAYGRNNFHTTYDIYSTPVVYVLDKDKKIKAKRLSSEQLDDILGKFLNKESAGMIKESRN